MPRSAGVRFFVSTLAVLVIGVVWITVIDRPSSARPPRPGSPRAATAAAPRLAAPPTAGDVLARADVLSLTTGQRARLTALASAWPAEVGPLQHALGVATEDFARFAREAQQAGRTRLDAVRARTEDVQSLSALVRERRARHAAATLSILTPAQRDQLTLLRQMTGGTR